MNNNLTLINLNESHIESVEKIWLETHLENLKSIVGKDIVNKYLTKFFRNNKNKGFGVADSHGIIAFVLFGKDNSIIKEIFLENFFLIFKSFFTNLIKLNIKHVKLYINCFLFFFFSRNDKKKFNKTDLELLIISVNVKNQGTGLGSLLISSVLEEKKKYISMYKNIFVKTLRATPLNIKFYQKNNFIIVKEIFGRVYLNIKLSE